MDEENDQDNNQEEEQEEEDETGDQVHGCQVHVDEVEAEAHRLEVRSAEEGAGQLRVEPGEVRGHEAQAEVDILSVGGVDHHRQRLDREDVAGYLHVASVEREAGRPAEPVEKEKDRHDQPEQIEVEGERSLDEARVKLRVVEIVDEHQVAGS